MKNIERDNIVVLYGKYVIASLTTIIDDEQYDCVVLDGGDYWDIHILNERFKWEELSTLQQQIPKSEIDEFTDELLLGYILEFCIWDKYSDNEYIVSSYIQISVTQTR